MRLPNDQPGSAMQQGVGPQSRKEGAGPAPPRTERPRVTVDPDSPEGILSRQVADWITGRFLERSHWLVQELVSRGLNAGFDLWLWWDSPAVKALGIRSETRPIPWRPGEVSNNWLTIAPETLKENETPC